MMFGFRSRAEQDRPFASLPWQTQILDLYVHYARKTIYDYVWIILLLLFEAVLGIGIIRWVPYTEIDWEAYMQEVEMWLIQGEYDYRKIRGSTGPLVYPAGFLYIFAVLRSLSDRGNNIVKAQSIFYFLYLCTQGVVLMIYQQFTNHLRHHLSFPIVRSKGSTDPVQDDDDDDNNFQLHLSKAHQIWAWRVAMALLCLSKRLHSIFMLRLFNDSVAMLLLYLSILLMVKQAWNAGCLVFSLAVSVKMNVLLFAPGLLLLLLQVGPTMGTVILRLTVGCALPQLVLGAPFLSRYPISYLRKAFEVDRVFLYEWTVNWKFLPEHIFLSKPLSGMLLGLHLGTLAYMALLWLRRSHEETGRRIFCRQKETKRLVLSPHYIIYTMLVSNFVGICFARTLHYQFYTWYFHAIPYLLWTSSIDNAVVVRLTEVKPQHGKTQLPRTAKVVEAVLIRIGWMLVIELAFLTFPATMVSSLVLQTAHAAILVRIRPPRHILVMGEFESTSVVPSHVDAVKVKIQ